MGRSAEMGLREDVGQERLEFCEFWVLNPKLRGLEVGGGGGVGKQGLGFTGLKFCSSTPNPKAGPWQWRTSPSL